MADEEFEFKIDVRTEPRPIKIGEDTFYLIPEIMSPEFIDSFNKFDAKREELVKFYEDKISPEVGKALYSDEESWKEEVAKRVGRDPEYLRDTRGLMKTLISKFMENDSASEFLEKTYPDRVYALMTNKLIEVYSGRPTTLATDSGGQ